MSNRYGGVCNRGGDEKRANELARGQSQVHAAKQRGGSRHDGESDPQGCSR